MRRCSPAETEVGSEKIARSFQASLADERDRPS